MYDKLRLVLAALCVVAQLPALGADAGGATACPSPVAAYRKKIAAVFFPVLPQRHVLVNDYHGYERGIAAELTRRLAADGRFLTLNAGDVNLYADPERAPGIDLTTSDGRPLVVRLAHERGAQFVVSGVVRDLALEQEDFPFTWMNFPPRVTARRLELEFFVHDALSGELLARHRFARRVEGADLLPRRAEPFGTEGFFASPFGQLFDRVLSEETAAIDVLLRCRPAVMKVIEQRGERIYLDAGADTGIRVGDRLTLYRPDVAAAVFGAAGEHNQFGHPKAQVQVVEVFPGYAVVEPEGAGEAPAPGEYLRAW